MATTPLAPLTGKRILVTGITGMVAGPMGAQLAAAGNTVWGAARFASSSQESPAALLHVARERRAQI